MRVILRTYNMSGAMLDHYIDFETMDEACAWLTSEKGKRMCEVTHDVIMNVNEREVVTPLQRIEILGQALFSDNWQEARKRYCAYYGGELATLPDEKLEMVLEGLEYLYAKIARNV